MPDHTDTDNLQQLLKFTTEDHPDYRPLQRAVDLLEGIVTDINDFKRDADHSMVLSEFQKVFDTESLEVRRCDEFHDLTRSMIRSSANLVIRGN